MIDTRLPLTDIHRHLDGNIRAQTILDLGRQFNLTLPAQTLESLIPHVQVTSNEPDLVSFLSKLDWGVKMLASLDACRRVAFENIEDAARNGLHYVELRFSPGYMAMTHNLPVAGVVEAVIEGVREGCKTFDVQARLIGIMSRTFGEAACLQELEALLAHRDAITAVDLAGDELGFPGSLFLSHFNRARDAGWHITVHAGEAAGPESIWQAIRELGTPSVLVYLRCGENEQLRRVRRRRRNAEKGITLDYLHALNRALESHVSEIRRNVNVVEIDSEIRDFARDEKVTREVLGEIYQALGAEGVEEVLVQGGYLQPK